MLLKSAGCFLLSIHAYGIPFYTQIKDLDKRAKQPALYIYRWC
ncbi:hypothetical protein HMPREF0476_1921 [Kingella kingae ATCC 23330]|uniref:Uncharacterized protein n=1 Tax=Kingella kingae ATCC 23330 TaxID=887327 RepID=F5S9N8_KINKI|nr:hypothetical protein HMPREF0476_1921 [Kingella kingae ATCC 23330]